jgi:hypothetical protein
VGPFASLEGRQGSRVEGQDPAHALAGLSSVRIGARREIWKGAMARSGGWKLEARGWRPGGGTGRRAQKVRQILRPSPRRPPPFRAARLSNCLVKGALLAGWERARASRLRTKSLTNALTVLALRCYACAVFIPGVWWRSSSSGLPGEQGSKGTVPAGLRESTASRTSESAAMFQRACLALDICALLGSSSA